MKEPVLSVLSLATCLSIACAPSQEATRVELAVAVDGGQLVDAPTDLGWTIHLDAARVATGDLEFTIQGEMHALARLWDLLVPPAIAHPGHYAGGDVTGALPGSFVLDWIAGDGVELGRAELLTGNYHGCNIAFRRADELPADDPLAGHTAQFAGTATKDGQELAFTAILDLDVGASVIGAPFDLDVDEASDDTLGVQLRLHDDVSGAALFDGVDFAALDPGDGSPVTIGPGDPAHNLVRRALQSHVFYTVAPL
ncbi:hypothetical protein [Nannocystis punicea]|uniref:Uncharacterized protein n=1 Tax=Nannocystis punicea TaxID=2995304 RepID=A0ABY7HK79_9BACT|nr:hypothetical protein [Nannocystis poenicansa]WAS99430.1 hypothetical protein O0S08_25170 [Nannocystis poenicansa]